MSRNARSQEIIRQIIQKSSAVSRNNNVGNQRTIIIIILTTTMIMEMAINQSINQERLRLFTPTSNFNPNRLRSLSSSRGRQRTTTSRSQSLTRTFQKYIIIIDCGLEKVLRDQLKAEMYTRKQIVSAFKLKLQLTEEELYQEVETFFKDILDLAKPRPR